MCSQNDLRGFFVCLFVWVFVLVLDYNSLTLAAQNEPSWERRERGGEQEREDNRGHVDQEGQEQSQENVWPKWQPYVGVRSWGKGRKEKP